MHASRLLLVIALCSIGPARGADPDPTKGDRPFDGITASHIKKALAGGTGKDAIDGSATPANKIPAGTVLLYVTSDGRFGKVKVVEYGYNLTLKWVTYRPDGSVFSKGDKLVVRGTWTCDLDHGTEGRRGRSRPDFWWEQVDRVKRRWVPQNGARFVVYRGK